MDKNINNEIRGCIKRAYEDACNAYLKAFCEKHEYDYEDASRNWVGGTVGEITEVSDYFVDMSTIRDDIDMNAPVEEFVKWYDYTMRLHGISDTLPSPNYRSWLKGCPRHSEEWFEDAERRLADIEKMKQELEECVKSESKVY